MEDGPKPQQYAKAAVGARAQPASAGLCKLTKSARLASRRSRQPAKAAIKWYYCKRYNHWWTDRSDIDHGMPTGFNKGEKDCATRQYSAKAEYCSRGTCI